ncbi:hypothetical protein OROGR_002423 [Orobanche gracilis]
MGGVVESGVGTDDKTSPRRAAIAKAQAKLRQGYEIRNKTKRELDFLLEGGDPLELECGNAASVSVQSTSFTDQHPDQFLTSEAKGSFAFIASPHEDSVESSGILGTNSCEPNSADNLMLFDNVRELFEGNRSLLHPSRSNIVSSEKLCDRRTRDHRDLAAFGIPRKAYKRRYRSRPNRDGTRSSSTDVNPTRGSHGSSLPSSHGPRDVKGLISDVENQIILSNSNLTSPLDDKLQKTELIDREQDTELDCRKAVKSTKDLTECLSANAASDVIACETLLDDQHNRQSVSGLLKTHIQMDSDGPEAVQAKEGIPFAEIECHPGMTAIKIDNNSSSCQMNGFSNKKGDEMKIDAHISASCVMKRLYSESSCNRTSQCIDGNKDTGMCTNMRSTGSNGQIKDQTSFPDKIPILEGDESVKEQKETGGTDSSTLVNVESSFACQSQRGNEVELQPEEEPIQCASEQKNEVKDQTIIEETEACRLTGLEIGRISDDPSSNIGGPNNENSCTAKHQAYIDVSISDLPVSELFTRGPTVSLEAQRSSGSDLKLARKIDEDSILKEAQIIEAKRKRIAELSIGTSPNQVRLKSHWDYVLEEMAWLANDFAQERVWKITAAAQTSSRAAFTSHLRNQDNNSHLEAKKVAHTLARSVIEFWKSVEETSRVLDQQSQRDAEHSVRAYAVRFRKYNDYSIVYDQAEVPRTPDRVTDMGTLDSSCVDNLTEENLFYTVLPGTMEMYRSSIESRVFQHQRIETGVLEEVETSACNAAADFDTRDDAYNEDGREINTYDMPMAFKDSKFCRFGQKKQKHLVHAFGVRPYDISSGLLVKRPVGNLDVSIPTKRVRTASRRVVSPCSAGTSGFLHVPNKTDASSSDTNSFQDDQGTPYSLKVESVGKFEKQLPFESAEVSMKNNKKKKAATDLVFNNNAAYEPRWQVDSTFQNEQRDQLRKSHQFEFNCSSGLMGQPLAKNLKTMRQSLDSSFENIPPIGGSVPSPVASQMSNMSNPNKFIKMLGGRDRGRKPKGLKMTAGQPGSGSPWTLFEDQALVVLAHDLGSNWELVSDAINSTLQFKCIFRKAKECKERHNFLMDRTPGDGADSTEDSGSSQPYPSTLPGIPKGSARQLFQRLQGPIEEDTLKSHFEKIIIIGQKRLYRKTQEPKQLQQLHCSHTAALSQVCPNNLNGGSILTPLDLCAVTGTDLLPLGHQGPHSGGLTLSNQGTATTVHPASGTSSALQGSPDMIVGNNFSSSPSSINSSIRDARHGLPSSASLSADDQQRMQQYNQMISNRSVSQSNISVPGTLPGTDRGVRMLPGGSGMGLVSGVNRSMPVAARPGFQGMSSSVVNPVSMVSPDLSPTNVHSGVGPSQGSSTLRPRESLHMKQPGLGQDSKRQIMTDLQMQASPVMPHFCGLSPSFSNQSTPPVPSCALHHQPSRAISPPRPQVHSPHPHPHFAGVTENHSQQQAYTMRLAKERLQQHRFLQQPQMSHIQSQSQLPPQNNPQAQPQTGSPPVSLSPVNSVKQQPSIQGGVQNASAGSSGLTIQNNSKQRQRQQLPQANRQHPQQRQRPPNKVAKGVGRGKPMMHQSVTDLSLVNGVSSNPGEPVSQKKNYSSSSTKNLHQMTSHTDKSNQGHIPAVGPPGQSGSNHQQTQSHQKLVNQNQLALQKVVQNRKVNSNQPNKPQPRDSGGDQYHTSSSTEMDTMTALPQATRSSEPLLDPNALNSATNMNSLVSIPSNTNESAGQCQGQGLGQRSLPASLPSNNAQAPNSPVPQSQQHQLSLSLHSQQQVQLLQAGNGDSCSRPSDHRLE